MHSASRYKQRLKHRNFMIGGRFTKHEEKSQRHVQHGLVTFVLSPPIPTGTFFFPILKNTRHKAWQVLEYYVLAISFKERRRILPVVFFGSSSKISMTVGTLYFTIRSAQNSRIASTVNEGSFKTT